MAGQRTAPSSVPGLSAPGVPAPRTASGSFVHRITERGARHAANGPTGHGPGGIEPGAGPAGRPPRPTPGATRPRMRGRHVRALGYLRPPVPVVLPETSTVEDRLVLQVLRRRPVDLDAVQVAVLAALPPSVAAASLQRLVVNGLARDTVVGARVRYGLP